MPDDTNEKVNVRKIFDADKSEAFSEKLLTTLNHGPLSLMHCMTVSLSQSGEGLGAMWGEEKAREYLLKAAFKSIETNQLAHDIQNNWYVVRK